ncbi:MAG: beta-galactosidase [Sedimentisphaerales bacterium]|nr:beta-galactosidase [Sedimentisphaerales bacterium]
MKRRDRCPSRTLMLILLAAGTAIALSGCAALTGESGKAKKLGLVAVTPDGTGFVEQIPGLLGTELRPFVPFGTNYYDPNTGWPPKLWQQFDPDRVTQHFRVMSELGVNCARVFLTAGSFQPDVNTVDEQALEKLDTLVKIAREARIHLILTGPDHWEGSPAYWKPDRFAGAESLRALEYFWSVVAQRYAGEPAIFAWDLLNEPQMPWFVESWRPQWNTFLKKQYGTWPTLQAAYADDLAEAESWGDIAVPKDEANPGNRRLQDWQVFRESLADEWVRRQAQAIRQADPTARVTVGYIQWSYPVVRIGDPSLYSAFNPRRQEKWLDFVSIHFYPAMGHPFASRANWEMNLAYLQSVLAYCHTGKPVVLGEYGWYGGGAAQGRPYLDEHQQARWIVAEIEASRRLACGWLSWPLADTPDSTDMSRYGGMVKENMIRKIWAWRFKSYAAGLADLSQPTPELPEVDVTASLTAPVADLVPMQEKHAERIAEALRSAGALPEIQNRTQEMIRAQGTSQ